MFIGGHYLKCLRVNALSVQCQVEFIEYMCVCMCVCVCVCVSTEIISVSNLWDVLTSVVQVGKTSVVQIGKEIYTSSAFYS